MPHMLPRDQQIERNKVIAALAIEEGLDQTQIAERIEQLGYGRITNSRVGQVMVELSGRDRVQAFLTKNPDERFEAAGIALALDIDVGRVMYAVESLKLKGIVDYDESRADNGHHTQVNIGLRRGAKAKAARKQRKLFTLEPIEYTPEQALADEQAAVAPLEVEEGLARPWVDGSLGGFPAFRAVRDRYVKAKKLTEAAAILEEVGEDEIALQLMTRTEFTPLEDDVIAVLRYFGEVDGPS